MDFATLLTEFDQYIIPMIRILALVFVGLPLAFILSGMTRRKIAQHYTAHHAALAGKAVFWIMLLVILIAILNQLGFPLTHLLGAAGIASVAIGFASQTSLSNVISGLFLIGEKPFAIGDIITVDGNTGEVYSIDALSVKVRCFDNRFVRIPNETLIKTNVVNVTRFPLRRIDFNIGVAYREDMDRVKEVLKEEAKKHKLVLDLPEPLFLYTGFGSSSIDILFGVWAEKADFLTVKNDMMIAIKKRFDEEDIEIPFPHLSLYTGSKTDAMPIKLQQQSDLVEASQKVEADEAED